MNSQYAQLLKLVSAELMKNTNLGNDNFKVIQPTKVFLPAGTLLESGNVRIPLDLNSDENINLEKVEQDNVAGTAECNNQNVTYFTDLENNIYSNIPNSLPNVPPGNGNQVCYSKIPKETNLEIINSQQNINMKLNEDLWCLLIKGTKVKFEANTEIEFRVNGSWHRIKLIKAEYFKI